MTMTTTRRRGATLAAPFALLILSGCVADPPGAIPVGPPLQPTPPVGACDAARAESLVGGRTISDPQARRETGALDVRQVGPNDPLTRDMRIDRVTIINDDRAGRILDAGCY